MERARVGDVPDEDLERFPVESVSWHDAQRFLAELNRKENVPGWTYRMPTVTEWEYALRGGPMADPADGTTWFYFDRPTDRVLPGQASFKHDQAPDRPSKVGSFVPNKLGLHDLHGNVYEWTADACRSPFGGVGRFTRGGAFWVTADQLKSGNVAPPDGKFSDVGLRLVRVPVVQANPRRDDFDAWRKEVAALPAEQQPAAVADLLRVRNPGFHDKVTHRVVGGVVTELRFFGDSVEDLEPVRALAGLRVLRCTGGGGGRGAVADLGPLRGLPLNHLDCGESLVEDLTPLEGMPLRNLQCSFSRVSDLAPLKGMKLTVLWCRDTRVSDLEPVKDMPLVELNCEDSPVADLTPLRGMKQLAVLRCRGARVTDLSPLRGLPLRELTCDFQPERDAAILRSLKTLQTINDKPAADFWKAVGEK